MTATLLVWAMLFGSLFHFDPGKAGPTPEAEFAKAQAVASADAVQTTDPWWQSFNDPILNQCVVEALSNNRDMAVAIERLEDAKALLRQNMANQAPSLSGMGEFSRGSKLGDQQNSQTATDLDELAGQVSYESDFWSRLRHATAAAKADLLATAAARDLVHLDLAGSTAKAYFLLRAEDRQLQIAQATLETRKKTLALEKLLYEQGNASELEYRQAESEEQAVETTVQMLTADIQRSVHALMLLMGRNPDQMVSGDVPRGATLSEMPIPPEVPEGLSSKLLEKRPDIRQAEAALVAAKERVAEARAACFPTISLTGLFGNASNELSDLFSGQTGWSVATNITGSIFDAGKNRAKVRSAEAQATEALANYQKTVQSAFRDVLDALTSRTQYEKQQALYAAREQTLARALELAKVRFYGGNTSQMDVLDAQRSLLSVQMDSETNRLNRLNAAVDLYLALGGDWRKNPPETPMTTASMEKPKETKAKP